MRASDQNYYHHHPNNKALVNCCTIDWFTEWPEEALRTVAGHFLNTLEMEEATRSGLVDVCVQMQEMVTAMTQQYRSEMGRFYYVTPTSYLELISSVFGSTELRSQDMAGRVCDGSNIEDAYFLISVAIMAIVGFFTFMLVTIVVLKLRRQVHEAHVQRRLREFDHRFP